MSVRVCTCECMRVGVYMCTCVCVCVCVCVLVCIGDCVCAVFFHIRAPRLHTCACVSEWVHACVRVYERALALSLLNLSCSTRGKDKPDDIPPGNDCCCLPHCCTARNCFSTLAVLPPTQTSSHVTTHVTTYRTRPNIRRSLHGDPYNSCFQRRLAFGPVRNTPNT